MSRIGFVLKPDKTVALRVLEQLLPWVSAHGHDALVSAEEQIAPKGVALVPEDRLGQEIDFCVVLGGDGTILRAARLVAAARKPILGVNLGQLGFLTGFSVEEAPAAMALAAAGQLPVSERTRLAVTFKRPGAEPVQLTAVNDAVIHQGAMAKLVERNAYIDDEFVAAYRADGLIVATPTGSTAYNMAAGGPIVAPGHAAMTLTPICAHALTHRALVLPAAALIRLVLRAESRSVVLTVDGQWAHSFVSGDTVEITAADVPLRLFASKRGYFDIMRDKLHWGMRSDEPRPKP